MIINDARGKEGRNLKRRKSRTSTKSVEKLEGNGAPKNLFDLEREEEGGT